ncbi:tellurite resistance/C4-dicarboxylate transporter family protein [Spirosoma taeanense]|uniref:tellurite resistance/C4-dicarboxylate transporter family protein n=1 Tax=Spirosoma taeanense TaxID=2735870 RepID=UPI001F04AB8F|nr:tellurite resistance/C4-dicarboxylate transporter family protein [Spirosoma taeanense]
MNNVEYGVLIILLSIRLVGYFPALRADLASYEKGAGFFTVVAGSCILGTQYGLVKQNYLPATLLWLVALVLWLLLFYSFLTLVITQTEKPPVEKSISGVWLLLVVATQSLAILGVILTSHLIFSADITLFFALSAYLLGLVLYLILVTLIVYRLAFLPVSAEEFKPPYWIVMGAAAISTLSGVTLIQKLSTTGLFLEFRSVLTGMSLLAWATSTGWIPLLAVLSIWRYVVKKVTLTYHPQYWAFVFCMGMYSVCSWRLAEVMTIPYLKSIAGVFLYISLAAWLATFLWMGRHIIRAVTPAIGR